MVVVWRFYDGYEDVYAKLPDEERAVVTYIVLGSFDGTTVVCYIDGAAVGAPGSLGAAVGAPGSLGAAVGAPGSLGAVGAAMGAIVARTHAKAWRHAEMPLATAQAYVEQAKRNDRVSLDSLQHRIAHLKENHASLDASGYRLAYGMSYCDALIRETAHEIRVRQVRDAFLLQVS